jgi:trans-aconitate 2-methyltransferase
VVNWDGQDYARVSALQRTMAEQSLAGLQFDGFECVLDVGCGDGFLTRALTDMVPHGQVFGMDASRPMVAAAQAAGGADASGPWFVAADARHIPFADGRFDVVVSFNALHWVPEQQRALTEIAGVLSEGGRALIQVVCASPRASVESIAMTVCRDDKWAARFDGFAAPFIHVDPDGYAELVASAGLTVTRLTVADREWDFGSRAQFEQWCTVGSTAWTDRLDPADRPRFVEQMVRAYEAVSGRPGLFLFTQMRAELRR